MGIFKYATFERIDILSNAHIRFTQPSSFNDPFELLPYFESVAPEKNVKEYMANFQWNNAGTDKILEECWAKELEKYNGLKILCV